MSRVLVNNLNIRAGPSTSSEKIGIYSIGQIINSGELLIENEGNIWLKFTIGSGNTRYVMAYDKDKTPYIDVEPHIPGPRGNSPSSRQTGIPGIPFTIKFPDPRIQNWGDCFLCVCVKGGLTTLEQCMDCFKWGLESGKLRNSDCYIACNKEEWAKEISSKYDTTYHEDYVFQKSLHGFWLTQNGKQVFNPQGLVWPKNNVNEI